MDEKPGQSLADYALSYARRGWPVFPLRARGKVPLTVRGFKDATTDEATIRAWWQRWPDANIGMPTGKASDTAVVDIDPRHGGDITLEQLIERHGEMPETLVCLTGGGGKHLYFRFAQGFRNSAGQIGAGIDTRGEGGYVVLPPSVHDCGREYAWDDDDSPLADLPDWLNPSRIQSITPRIGAGNLDFTAGKDKANGEPVAPGGRNVAAASLAGQFIRAGDSLAETVRKLRAWNKSNPVPLPEEEIEMTAASVARTHVSKHPGDEVRIGDIPEETAPPVERKQIQPFPQELLSPPGFVGQLVAWINETAIKPQPVLALGNALAFFGAVIGRKVRTPSDLRSNVYVLGVGESGCGKDHSRKCIKRICGESGITADLLGGEEVSSDSAILAAVHSHPAILFQFDEIGHFLANANSRYAASHMKNIAPTFTKLFSSANTTYIGKEYAGNREREDIQQPCVCLYGTTVPGRLYEGLTPGEISDGFLGRMLVFQSNDPDPVERDVVPGEVPKSIISTVQAWRQRDDMPRPAGNIASLNHVPITVEFEPEAKAAFARFKQVCRERKREHRGQGGLDVLWTRAGEHAMKVALVVACGCEFQVPLVSGQVAEWSVALVDYLVTALVETVRDSVAGNEYERDVLFVQRIIKEAGDKGISRTELCLKTRKLRAQLRTDILTHLIDTAQIKRREVKAVKGAAAVVYHALL